MKLLEFRFVDKSGWPIGPWTDEVDARLWRDDATGYPCRVLRSVLTGAFGACVGVREGHPLYGVLHGDAKGIDVMGGLDSSGYMFVDADFSAWSGKMFALELSPRRRKTVTGRDYSRQNDFWWFGFEAGGFTGFRPAEWGCHGRLGERLFAADAWSRFFTSEYCDVEEASRGAEGLAGQLRRIEIDALRKGSTDAQEA